MEAHDLNKLEKLANMLKKLEDGPLGPFLAQGQEFLAILCDRLALGPGAALVVLAGPTGAGKSHIFNALAGEEISPAGLKRPFTMAPVLMAPEAALEFFKNPLFLPGLKKEEKSGPVDFSQEPAAKLYLVPTGRAPWPWPPLLALCDTPDFDSVLLENQSLSEKLTGRSDAVILVLNPSKYADESAWRFLAELKEAGRPALLVLNRLNNRKLKEDLKKRLAAAGYDFPLMTRPDENGPLVGELFLSEKNLADWLLSIGQRAAELSRAETRRCALRFTALMEERIIPGLSEQLKQGEKKLFKLETISQNWREDPQRVLRLSLPAETRKALESGLGALVSKADFWTAPRRLAARPFLALRDWLRKDEKEEAKAEAHGLIENLNEVSREALVAALRREARNLRRLLDLEEAPAELDLTPEEIRNLALDLEEKMKSWLAEESRKILQSLPVGKKALLYFVQLSHAGLVVGLTIHLGGLPGAETLVGGALGPLISKLTGTALSREAIRDFEERAQNFHKELLGGVYEAQAARYRDYLKNPLAALAEVPAVETLFKEIKKGLP